MWLLSAAGLVAGLRALLNLTVERNELWLATALAVGVGGIVPSLMFPLTGGLDRSVLVLGALGTLVWLAARRRTNVALSLSLSPQGHSLVGQFLDLGVAGLIVSVLIVTDLWDRQVHIGFVGALARGVVPLELPAFPGEPFAYHVGFDVFVASMVALARIDADVAIDVAQALLAAIAFVGIARGLYGPVPGLVALALLVHGPLALCTGSVPFADICDAALPAFPGDYTAVPPPVSGFFQPSFIFGMVVAVAVLSLLRSPRTSTDIAARVWACVALWTLSEANLVLFSLVGSGLAVVSVRDVVTPASRRRGVVSLGCLAAVGGAWLAWGSFRFGGDSFMWGRGFFGEHPGQGVLVFMTPALLGVVLTLRRWRKGLSDVDIVLVVTCALGTAIGCSISYRHSWDIVKFLHVAALAGSLLLASQTLRDGSKLLWGTVTACSIVGLAWLLRLGPLNGTIATRYVGGTDQQVEIGRRFLATFGDVVAGRDCVFTPATSISAIGVLTPGAKPTEYAHLLRDQSTWQKRHEQWQSIIESPDFAGLEAFGCPWAFLPDGLMPTSPRVPALPAPTGTLMLDGEQWGLYRVALTSPHAP